MQGLPAGAMRAQGMPVGEGIPYIGSPHQQQQQPQQQHDMPSSSGLGLLPLPMQVCMHAPYSSGC